VGYDRASGTFSNWSRIHQSTPSAFHQPGGEEELAHILGVARSSGEGVKVVGAGHSWSAAACTDGHLLNLDRMNRVIEIDRQAGLITVEAGIRLNELNDRLDDAGLAMSNLGSISEQSIAGAISTATHGSGGRFGNLASAVVGLRLMTADGNVHDVSPDDTDLFSASRVSLGALGIVTQVTVQVEPAFNLRERVVSLPFDEAVERMDELVDASEHVKLWWLPHTGKVRVSSLDRTTDPVTSRPRPLALAERVASKLSGRDVDIPGALDRFLNQRGFPFVLSLTRDRPKLTPPLNRLIRAAYLSQDNRVGHSVDVFNLTMPAIHREMEYGIPRADAAHALVETRNLIERRNLYVNFIVEVRFVAEDDIMLSGAYGRDSCQLGAYIGDCDSAMPYFEGFESMCLELGGRPHWGKELFASRDQLAAAFPKFEDFDRLRRELDPHGMFENTFVQHIFGS
jgi:L-gulonolactone oxidase